MEFWKWETNHFFTVLLIKHNECMYLRINSKKICLWSDFHWRIFEQKPTLINRLLNLYYFNQSFDTLLHKLQVLTLKNSIGTYFELSRFPTYLTKPTSFSPEALVTFPKFPLRRDCYQIFLWNWLILLSRAEIIMIIICGNF